MSHQEVKLARYNNDLTISLLSCSNNVDGEFHWVCYGTVEEFLNGAEFTHDNSCIEGNGNFRWIGEEVDKPDWWPVNEFPNPNMATWWGKDATRILNYIDTFRGQMSDFEVLEDIMCGSYRSVEEE